MSNEEFLFFNEENFTTMYSEIDTKCLLFTLLDEFLRLKCMNLTEDLKQKIKNVIEDDWKNKYKKFLRD